jgi:hypothetical protein
MAPLPGHVLHLFLGVKNLEGSLSTSSELHLGAHTAVLFVQLLAEFWSIVTLQ